MSAYHITKLDVFPELHFSFQKLLRPKGNFLILHLFCCCLILSHFNSSAQTPNFIIKELTDSGQVSLRGLSVVNDNIIWASGSEGTVARSVNGGKDWQWLKIAGYEHTDFRDIEAFSAQKAIVMGIASPAYILLTQDGGQSWQKVYENTDSTTFLDGMAWLNAKQGFAYGDPQNGKFLLIKTNNGGKSWQPLDFRARPKALKKEASFAASGTAIFACGKKNLYIATGGDTARLLVSKNKGQKWQSYACPVLQGKSSTGIFSLSFLNKTQGIIIGGDYANDKVRFHNCFLTKDGGRHWQAPLVNPFGYRSCVIYIDNKHLIATGTSGTDISTDGGMTWENISQKGFHVVQKAKKGSAVFLAGANGRIARLILQ